MSTMNTNRVLEFFQPRLGDIGTLVVAGGAVRDELMGKTPKDFDLFLLWANEWNFEKVKETLLPRLEGLSRTKPKVEWHKSEPYLVADLSIDGAEVQILCNPAENAEALVETFDWSVCLFARTQHALIQRTPLEEIGEGKELRLNRCTFPLSTLRRGFRFSERFKMRLRREDIATLCEAVLKNVKTGNEVSANGNEPDMGSLSANTLIEA